MDWFAIQSIDEKIRRLPEGLTSSLQVTEAQKHFVLGRDLRVVDPAHLPPKPGLSSREGQARLLHDLASIELQAMELAVRTLVEYPEAPKKFRDELSAIAESESEHLQLCLQNLRGLGFDWGSWDAHLALWDVVGPSDTLLDRILIVHRYLEGSGLDAGASIMRRLTGVGDKSVRQAVAKIVDEEVGHVEFGSRWYRKIAEANGVDSEAEFARRVVEIARIAPRRERLAREVRKRAGFTDRELDVLEYCQPGKVRA